MSDLDNTNIGVSSCVSGIFNPLKEDTSSGNTWAFCFNKNQNRISLNVTINTPAMLVDMSNQHLDAEFALGDINQLLVWLFQVKTSMQQAKKQAESTASSSSDKTSSTAVLTT
ncbi:hypothetical protein [Shewanella surugensis]|uniref:Uncharacterized protein n=1 Tax=Shewanella surugensis TaxID=212020 RepID=A0ABT0LEH5_9GAMM|nr:hypothetical protein [Shewanella surugensis]MCL1126098.1 hypothetical protein [Shewanella surugensis]